MGRAGVSSSSQTKPYFTWVWEQVLSPAYLKALDVLGPKMMIGLSIVFIIPEVGDVVPSVSDWLNLFFDIGIEWRDNLRAGTEFING